MTQEAEPGEIDKKLTLRLEPGQISGLFRILEDELIRILSGEGSDNLWSRVIILPVSINTVYDLLEAASANNLPVRKDILGIYSSFIIASLRGDQTTGAAQSLLERQRKEYDPYTRKLTKSEGFIITGLPIYKDQLNLISTALLVLAQRTVF